MNSLSLDRLTISSTLPTLPSELIDEILREETLSKFDLLRCCLVSHQFLPIPRQRLYGTARIILCLTRNYGEISGTFQARDPTSELLLRTWKESSFLRRQVTKLHLDGIKVTTDRHFVRSEDVAETLIALQVSEILELLPRIDSLKVCNLVWQSLWVQELMLERGEQWWELDLGGTLTDASLETGERGYKFANLRKLRCGQLLVYQPWPTLVPSIEIFFGLDLFQDPFPTSPPPQLRVIGTLISNLRYVVTYANLQHLHLLFDTDVHLNPEVLVTFSKLAHLESLTITVVQTSSLWAGNQRVAFLAPVPSTLTHLNFPDHFPLDALSSFLSPALNTPPRLQVFHLHLHVHPMAFTLEYHEDEIEILKGLCQAKGIRFISARNPKDDLLCTSRFYSVLSIDCSSDAFSRLGSQCSS